MGERKGGWEGRREKIERWGRMFTGEQIYLLLL
jgi:hypothetical protein